jgi:hypothetical protein
MQREVIKWVQSLDLSFAVHNPRRDLSNGFIVAEILSRYDKGVSMHSFDTGSALARKLDNWAQVKKILKRLQCGGVTDELAEGALQGREGCGNAILEQLYSFLTKRALKSNVIAARAPAAVPAYARSTAAKILRDNNDTTKERCSGLTGKQDELKLRQANEELLEGHQVSLQTQKFDEPARFKPRPRTVDAAAKDGKTTPRPRQKLASARQMAVRAMDDGVIAAFAERLEHEREESFKAQFDAGENLARALARVVQRPLDRAGLVESVDQAAAASGGGAAGDDYFAKFVQQRDGIAADVKALVWQALHQASANVAKHCNLRRDEFHHLLYGLDFLFKRDTAMRDSINDPARAFDVHHGLALIAEVGAQWQKIDAEAATATVVSHLVPAVIDCLDSGCVSMVKAYVDTLACFCNMRDAESIKALINAITPSIPRVARASLIIAGLLEHADVKLCLGCDALMEYYAVAFLSGASEVERCCAVWLVRLLCVPTAVHRAVALLDSVVSAAAHSGWEYRLQVLELLGELLRFSDVLADKGAFVVATMGDVFATFQDASSLVQKASLCVAAPLLDAHQNVALCDMFIERLLDLAGHGTAEVISAGAAGGVQAIPGKARAAYVAGGIVETWNPMAVASALLAVREERSSYEFLGVLEPLVLHSDLHADRDAWLAVAAQAKPDLVDAVLNPANSRGVTEGQMSLCGEMAAAIVGKLYGEISGEDDTDLHDDDEATFHKLQERGMDWLQHAV